MVERVLISGPYNIRISAEQGLVELRSQNAASVGTDEFVHKASFTPEEAIRIAKGLKKTARVCRRTSPSLRWACKYLITAAVGFSIALASAIARQDTVMFALSIFGIGATGTLWFAYAIREGIL